MISKNCVCGQLLWCGDRYCVACGRRVTWDNPQPKEETKKIVEVVKKDQDK